MIRSTLFLFMLFAPVILIAGCGKANSALSGQVTIDGQPLRKGFVSLDPEGGRGVTAGGEVRDGFYRIPNLKPGRYRLHISGEPVGTAGKTQAEVMAMPEEELQALTKNPIPAQVAGNDQMVEVTGGDQKHDVNLGSAAPQK